MNSLRDEDPRIVLFASVPDQNDLCCVSVYINPSEKHDLSAKSNFQWQILKCRQLIFSVPDILASPVLGSEREINIVMSHEYKESEKLQSHVEKLKLTASKPVPVTTSIYEACLRYTLIARIAPLWNQVGSYLLQGRNFLSTTSFNAIKLDVGINDGEMFVVLWPMRVRLPHVKLEDMEVPTKISQDFLSQTTACISDISLGSQSIYVLPSLKKGRVISISHQIPNSCPYRTYIELKRHWKNLYGYRLPETDESIIYYTLFFHSSNPTFYTYPSLCVRAQDLIFLRRVDQMSVLKEFLTDLSRKLPAVCGQKFAVSPKLAYAVPKLQQLNEDLTRANLSNLPYVKPKDLVSMDPVFLSPTLVNSFQMEPNKSESAQLLSGSMCTPQYPRFCSRDLSLMTSNSESALTPITERDNGSNEKNNDRQKAADSPPLFLPYSMLPKSTNSLVPNNLKTQTRFVPIFKRHISIPKHNKMDSYQLITSQSNPSSTRTASGGSQYLMDTNNCEILQSNQVPKPSYNSSMSQVMFQNMKYGHPHSNQSNKCIEGKKPRSRPQIQLDVDVEVLARNHDLARVNTATLVNWLRGKLVPCKVKDKKSDLVDKVMSYLNLPHH